MVRGREGLGKETNVDASWSQLSLGTEREDVNLNVDSVGNVVHAFVGEEESIIYL